MTLFGVYILRRPLSTLHIWPAVRRCNANNSRIWSRETSITNRHHSTVYSAKPKYRDVEKKAHEDLIQTLLYVLRQQVGRELGLENRQDDFVSLKLLLNYPEFRRVDMPTLQKIVDNDVKHRFDLKYDPTKPNDQWWIRAKKWNETHRFLKPIGLKDIQNEVVYSTTIDEWTRNISRIGLPKPHDPYIRLQCKIPAANYIDTLDDQDQVFVFLDMLKCLNSGMRFFTALPTAQPNAPPDHLLTKGDEWGFIPPEFFSKVDCVQAKKTLLWGDPDPIIKVPWSRDSRDFDETGARKTLVKPLSRNLHGFVDCLPALNYAGFPIPPETMQEAKETMQSTQPA